MRCVFPTSDPDIKSFCVEGHLVGVAGVHRKAFHRKHRIRRDRLDRGDDFLWVRGVVVISAVVRREIFHCRRIASINTAGLTRVSLFAPSPAVPMVPASVLHTSAASAAAGVRSASAGPISMGGGVLLSSVLAGGGGKRLAF